MVRLHAHGCHESAYRCAPSLTSVHLLSDIEGLDRVWSGSRCGVMPNHNA